MERYEFVATTTNKEKMITVIIPVVMVGLLAGLALVSYYFELDNYIEPYTLFKSLAIVLIIGVCFLLARKLQELLSKKYVVELDGNNINHLLFICCCRYKFIPFHIHLLNNSFIISFYYPYSYVFFTKKYT